MHPNLQVANKVQVVQIRGPNLFQEVQGQQEEVAPLPLQLMV